ncbi:UNVERIFIED_CONTAM: hypothetical protein HDU68_003057 [Siphonaria sp. JEL0065]|nr:hypothetical protein HDU68_003057 [Siphonaria sp. JEL0065]
MSHSTPDHHNHAATCIPSSHAAAARTMPGFRSSSPQPGQPHTSIDLDNMSTSSTSVYDSDDWASTRRLSTLARTAPHPSFSANPLAYIRTIIGSRPGSFPEMSMRRSSGLEQPKSHEHELEPYQKSNEPFKDESHFPSDSSNHSNGRRKLSLAFLQDMNPENEDATMGAVMGSHLERALRLTHAKSSKMTLGFINADVESDYESYFWSTMKKRWSMFLAIGGSISIAIQVAGLLGNNGDGLSGATPMDWGILSGAGIFPLVIIAVLPFVLSDVRMARSVHLASLAFLLVIGPMMTWMRYSNKHIRTDNSFNPSITAPIYIVGMVSSVFFLRLRFVHTVVATLVAAPTWYAVFFYAIRDSAAEKDSYILNSIVLFFACIVTCCVAFDLELSLRHQYLSNSRFLSITKNLQSQLDGLERSLLMAAASRNGILSADLSSPLERAMLAIRGMMADPLMDTEHLGVLELVMACLSSPNLLTPDLDVQVKEGNVAIDDEQEKWLFNEVATRRASRDPTEAGVEQLAQFETFKFGENDPQDVDLVSIRRGSTASAFQTPTAVIRLENLEAVFRSSETRGLLMRVPEFNFPIFDLAKSTDGRPLLALGYHLIQESGLLSSLNLDSCKFINFMATIESGYHASLAFHNSIHAADVLHCINYLVQTPSIRAVFTDLELLAIYIAASIHDFDHPGVNNQFLIATADHRALLYNDKSVLENHHCASAFEVMARKDCSFLSTLDRAEYKSLRENVVDMVLATDLAQHFSLLTMFKKKVLTGDTFDPLGTREDRTLLMQMLMKCSDVSNPTKIGPEYDLWIERIHEEWYMQGDMEKALGLPYSAFCNRDGPHASNPASSQTGFINFIVSPLYEAFSAWAPIEEVWQGLEYNKKRWADATAASEASQLSLKTRKSKAGLKLAPPVDSSSSSTHTRSPMRLKSLFSPASSATQQSMVSAASPHLKLTRSKSTTHAMLQLDSSLNPRLPPAAVHFRRRGSDSGNLK